MKNLSVVAAALLLAACQTSPVQENVETLVGSSVQEELTLAQVCAEYSCRENAHIHLRTDSQPVDHVIPVYWPRVYYDLISVLPGESFLVEADLIDGELINLREVTENTAPNRTIVIKFTQEDEGVDMMLSLYNPFKEVALKFNMDLIDFSGSPHQTSSCPALPQAFIYELWPQPIPELIIKNPVAISMESTELVGCVY